MPELPPHRSRPAPPCTRPRRRPLLGWLGLLLVPVLAPDPAAASAFGDRGPAAQAPTLADSAEIMVFTEQVPTSGSDYWSTELWDCNDGLGGQGGIDAGCTLDADLIELPGDARANPSTLDSLGNGVQVASAAGNFTDGTTEQVFLAIAEGGTTELFWCINPFATFTCAPVGGLGPAPFAPDLDVDVFGPDGALHRRLVQMTAAQLDEDRLDELVIAYWNDQERISITVLDWEDSGPGLQFYTRRELAPAEEPVLPATLVRSAVFGLGAVDFDGDLIDTIVVVAPSGAGLPGKPNDFDHFETSFFELVSNETTCGGAAATPCVLARGQDTFEEHKLALGGVGPPDGDHMDFYYPFGQGRAAGCAGPAQDTCYLGDVEVAGARLTPDASAASTLDRALVESLVVSLRYTFENGDGGNFREKTTDLVLLRPERDAGSGVDVVLGRIDGCTPSGGESAFAEETLCLAADPGDPVQGVNAVLHHRPLSYFTANLVFPQTDGMCLAVGDVGGSPLDEVALVQTRAVTLFDPVLAGGEAVGLAVRAQANLIAGAANASGFYQNDCDIAIRDLDADLFDQSNDLASWRPEIVVSRMTAEFEIDLTDIFNPISRTYHRRVLDVLRVDQDAASEIVGLSQTAASLNPVVEVVEVPGLDFAAFEPAKAFTTAFPDADDDRVLLGEPEVILSDLVSQPVLTLSAPPRHLDLVDEFDANDCVEPGKPADLLDFLWTDCDNNAPIPDCHGFESFYTSVQNAELSSSIQGSVSRSVGGGFSFPGFGASVERKFTDTSASSAADTVTVSQGTSTFFKDITVVRDTEYRIFEYPVLQGGAPLVSAGGDPVSVLITRNLPDVARGEDVMNVDLLLPTHVPGNLLSYKPLAWFRDPSRCGGAMSCTIGNTAAGGTLEIPFREVGVNIEPYGFFQIDDSNTTGTEATSEGNLAVSVGASATYKGLTVGVSGDYSQSTLRAHATTVKRETGLGWNFRDSSSFDPDLAYGATAIILVDENGALTLDYAVDIRPATCLEDVYSARPDPALALPLRRTEGSQAISNAEEDLQTKEIACRFDPLAGEYELAARVHNYSLADTGSVVGVDFHLGNPERGAPRIGTRVFTASSILPQDTGDNEQDVTLSVPAVCDGAGSIAEGTICITDDDCRVAGDLAGACVAELVPPYRVCDRDADTLEGELCTTDQDCRTGPSDEIGTCIPEDRLFVRLDTDDAIAEVSEDNNLGWVRLGGACTPGLPVPEPGLGIGLLVGAGALGVLRRRRQAA